MRTLFAIAAASLCGTVGVSAQEGAPLLGFEVQAHFLTMPSRTAERLGLVPRQGEPCLQSILDTAELGRLVKEMKGAEGVSFHTAPRIQAQPDSTSIVEQIREFRYPAEFAAADFSGAPQQMTHVLTPVAFETRNIGLTVSFNPSLTRDNMIDLKIDTHLVNFTDWAAYSYGKTAAATNGSIRPPGGFVLPIFATEHGSAEFRLKSGETVLMGGYPVLPEQTMDELIPKTLEELQNRKPQQAPPDHLRFILITAVAPSAGIPSGNLAPGEPIQLSTLLVSMPRQKAPKGFLTGAPGKSRAFNMRLLEPGITESLLQRWKDPDLSAQLFEGPKMLLSPSEEYAAGASGTLVYTNADAKLLGEQVTLDFKAKAKVETHAVISLELVANLDQETTAADNPRPKIEWKTTVNPSKEAAKSRHTFSEAKVALGKGQTLLMTSENSPNSDRVLFLLVKAVPAAK